MIGAFICFFIGLVSAFILGSALNDRARFRGRRIVKPMAEVVAVARYSDDDGDTRYRHTYAFAGENGANHRVVIGGHWKAATIGDRVELSYPEGYPERATIAFETVHKIKLYGSAAAFAICLAYAPFANWRELFFFLD